MGAAACCGKKETRREASKTIEMRHEEDLRPSKMTKRRRTRQQTAEDNKSVESKA